MYRTKSQGPFQLGLFLRTNALGALYPLQQSVISLCLTLLVCFCYTFISFHLLLHKNLVSYLPTCLSILFSYISPYIHPLVSALHPPPLRPTLTTSSGLFPSPLGMYLFSQPRFYLLQQQPRTRKI